MDHVDFLDVGRFYWNKKIETASFCGYGYACQTMENFFAKPWEEFLGYPVGLAVLKITYNDRLGCFKTKIPPDGIDQVNFLSADRHYKIK